MKRIVALLAGLLFISIVGSVQAQVLPPPPLMNFQGRLAKPDGSPLPDGPYTIRFSLWDSAEGGTELWNQTIDPISVRNGVFGALLDLSAVPTVFDGYAWMEIQVGGDPPLTPRQQVVSVAYAMKAGTVPDGSITTAKIADGAITAAKLDGAIFTGNGVWGIAGNAGLDAAINFLGTTDAIPLVLRTANQRGLQLELGFTTTPFGDYTGINTLGGSAINVLPTTAVGGTVFGGLSANGTDYPNKVTDIGGTVSGGTDNIAGSDDEDPGNAYYATVGGGVYNRAAGSMSTVPGGYFNRAIGPFSFAAGTQALANHTGSFVWADNAFSNFATTGNNQFLIRASGNVGINTNNPTFPVTLENGGGYGFVHRTTNGIAVGTWAGAGAGWLGTYSNHPLYLFINNGGASLAITNNGGVPRLESKAADFLLTGRGGGFGNNGKFGRALVDAGTNSGPGGLVINWANDFGKVTIGSDTFVEGKLSARVVEVTGADLAEKFEITDAVEPGMVVEINTEQEGKLRRAAGAYNKRVAGVISGAKKLNAGVVLTDPSDNAANAHPIAMSGRVWTYCDADANGPIEPGDLLTTADTPGYAMRVTDFTRSQGATIGKAMSSLKSGKGLVLVLVSLR